MCAEARVELANDHAGGDRFRQPMPSIANAPPSNAADAPAAPVLTPSVPAVVVTLVHGTVLFARWPRVLRILGAIHRGWSRAPAAPAWYAEASGFVERLTHALGDRRIHVTRFLWSGANTVWDRVCAAGADPDFTRTGRAAAKRRSPTLREHIAAVARDFPDAAHVLVAHSHGANVCLYALRDGATRQAAHGLVCLSTPFVHVRQRADSNMLASMLKVLGGVVYLALFLGASQWVSAHVPKPWDQVIFVSGFTVLLMAAAVFWARRETRRDALRAWANSIAQPDTHGVPTFVLLSDGDEALLALKIMEGLNVVARGLWRAAFWLPNRVVGAISRWGDWRVILYALLAVVTLGILLATDALSPLGPNPEATWSVIVILKFLAAAAIAPGMLLLVLILVLATPAFVAMLVGYPALVFTRWLAVGWGGSIGVDITAETCPLGTATVTRLTPAADARGLRHAHSYNDARAPDEIAGFIARMADAHAALKTHAMTGSDGDPRAGHAQTS
jgi:hypothetical protein